MEGAERSCGTHGSVIGLVIGHRNSFFIKLYRFSPWQRRTPINELSAVSQATYTRYADKVTNKMTNSPAQKRAHHQVSLPDALPPPSSPTRPGSPTLIGNRSEGLLTVENDAPPWTGEELTIRRTSFAEHLATTANRLDGM